MIKIVGGMGGSVSSGGDWWDVSSATPLAAWQAKGAASAVAAKLDLTGNGYNLTGADPTWSVADGFTSSVMFDLLSGALGDREPISAVWCGEARYGSSGAEARVLFWSDSDWNGGLLLVGSSDFYAGFNATYSPRITISSVTGNHTFIYIKEAATGPQNLYIDGSVGGTNAGGTASSDNSVYIGTSLGFHAAALYSGTLSNADIASISTALNNL